MPLTLLRRRLGIFFSLMSLSLFIWSCKSGGSSEGESDKIHVIENNFSDNPQDHFRLLTQTTFGPDRASLDQVDKLGVEGWIDHQLNMGSAYDSTSDNWPTHLERTIEIAQQAEPNVGWYDADDDGTTYFNEANGDIQVTLYQMAAWWDNVLGNPKYPALGQDQLRQRVAYALSQLLVTSNSAFPLNRRGEGLAYYYDLLAKHAFGNYRDLLSDVARSPTMGAYLSHQGNRKASQSEGTRPDENFAREVMQLFTIGLYELNLDGSPNRDGNLNTYPDSGSDLVPTYTQQDIEELAKVFTGWDLVGNKKYGRLVNTDGDFTQAMEFNPEFHEDEADDYYTNQDGKVTILGKTIALNATDRLGNASGLDAALDVLFAHDNIAPYVSKHLIKSFVTSNPSSEYIADVATVFNDDGNGTKGNLKSVVRAILTHQQARDTGVKNDPAFGKIKEPLLMATHLLRATDTQPLDGWTSHGGVSMNDVYWLPRPEKFFGYAPMRSPSVFNFFSPDFVPSDETFASNNWVAPELQAQTDQTLANMNNFTKNVLHSYEQNRIEMSSTLTAFGNSKTRNNSPLLLLNFDKELELMRKAIYGNSGNFSEQTGLNLKEKLANWSDDKKQAAIKALLDHLEGVLLGESMTNEMREAFEAFLGDYTFGSSEKEIVLNMIKDSYRFLVTSAHFMVQN